MKVSEIQILPIKQSDGLVGFASCVIDKCLYLGSIGIYKRIDGTGYRLTYPSRKAGNRSLNYYHPITKEAGQIIEKAVIEKCNEIFERSVEQDGRYSKIIDEN